jgi:hypothetical protein
MRQKEPGRAVSIVGVILVGVGILSVAYFASPIRLLLRETVGTGRINWLPLILGGLVLSCGFALLISVRQRAQKGKRDS